MPGECLEMLYCYMLIQLVVPFRRDFPMDILHHIALLSCATGIDAKCLSLVSKDVRPVALRFMYRRVSVHKERAADFSIDLYQKNPHLVNHARTFEVIGIDYDEADRVADLLHMFLQNFNLRTLKVVDIDFRTSLSHLILKIAHRFDIIGIDGCTFDDIHMSYLLNSVPTLRSLQIGRDSPSFVCHRTIDQYPCDDMHFTTVTDEMSSLKHMFYRAETLIHDYSHSPDVSSFYHALLDSSRFMDVLSARLFQLQDLILHVDHYSRDSAQQLLTLSGQSLRSLDFSYGYGVC